MPVVQLLLSHGLQGMLRPTRFCVLRRTNASYMALPLQLSPTALTATGLTCSQHCLQVVQSEARSWQPCITYGVAVHALLASLMLDHPLAPLLQAATGQVRSAQVTSSASQRGMQTAT